ncbi:MAG: VOC family protein [Mycobacteriales bacterium]
MSDPLDALRTPVVPVDPDPAFAARLRERLRRALLAPPDRTGGTVTTTGTTESRPRLRQGDVGHASLWVPDADRAAAFYGRVLGWRYRDGGPQRGRQVEGTNPSHGIWGGAERPNLMLAYVVDDLDAAIARVWDAGGRVTGPTRKPRGTVADCVDDQGLRFAVYEVSGDVTAAPTGGARPGDLTYVTLGVPDSARARAFYGVVLGWEFTPGRVEDGWTVKRDGADVHPMVGLWGGAERKAATAVPMYLVEDIDAAVAAVRAAGGTATEPEKQPYGITAECVDDQGTTFYLGQW